MSKWMLLGVLACPLLANAGALTNATGASAKTSPPIPRLIAPATGYWLDAERPGTGFSLERRGTTLGLAFYHFSDVEGQSARSADWHLASGPLVWDTFEATLLHFEGGSCLGCEPFAPADGEQTDTVVRLVFASAREAMLQIGDAAPRRIVAASYGVPYEPGLATPADLPLPDLRGRWLLEGAGERGVFTLDQRVAVEGGVEYRGPASDLGLPNASMRCDAQGCELWLDALPEVSPAPVPVADFHLGDITEERMTGADGMTFHVQVFRLEDTGVQP